MADGVGVLHALGGLTRLQLGHIECLYVLPQGPYLSSLRHLDLSSNHFFAVGCCRCCCRVAHEPVGDGWVGLA